MKFQISVSQNGQHIFTTSAASQSEKQVEELLMLFRKKFPTREQYGVHISIDQEEMQFYDSIDEYMRAKKKAWGMGIE